MTRTASVRAHDPLWAIFYSWRQIFAIFAVSFASASIVGTDPRNTSRHYVVATQFDWSSPGLESGIPGTQVRYGRLAPAAGSLTSLVIHELWDELDRSKAEPVEVARRAPEPTGCDESLFGDQLALADRHGAFGKRGFEYPIATTARDNRERLVISGGKLPSPIIPAEAPDGCAAPPSFLRLADFVGPPRLARQMGYLRAGYFSPS